VRLAARFVGECTRDLPYPVLPLFLVDPSHSGRRLSLALMPYSAWQPLLACFVVVGLCLALLQIPLAAAASTEPFRHSSRSLPPAHDIGSRKLANSVVSLPRNQRTSRARGTLHCDLPVCEE